MCVQRLRDEFVKASRDPELVKRLDDNGTLIATSTPQEMGAMLADEVKNMAELVNALGLKPQ